MGSKRKLTDILLCPKCGHSLSSAIRADIEAHIRQEFETERNEWLAGEKTKLERKAKEAAAVEIADMKEALAEKEKSNEKLRKEQLTLRKKERELEEAQAELKIEVERRLEKEKRKLLEQAVESVGEQNRLKLAEKDKAIADMHRQIEDLKRRSDVSSQKLQGDVQEEDLAQKLAAAFSTDEISRVKSGKNGADAVQIVRNSRNQQCGKILFESKRTKSFANDWIAKLRADMRVENADIGVIVSDSLPMDVSHATLIDGVWVISLPVAVPFATALRSQLIEIKQIEAKMSINDSTRDQIFSYISGPAFRQRLTAILEAFVSMQTQLEAEQRAMNLQWAKRGQTIQSVIENTARMYGELSAIATLPEIPQLALPGVA